MPITINKITLTPPKTLLSPGHRACAGCGQMIAARLVADALGPKTIIANATGCLEVVTTAYPESSWGLPWIHSLFENAAPVASGIRAALDYKSKIENRNSKIFVVAQGGDGGTFDIGFGLISGLWERGENILYVCYDNEGYMNTGAQASAATPWAANTTTTPAGKSPDLVGIGSHFMKKDMLAVALAHGLKYVAQTTVAYPLDIIKKVKRAAAAAGPSYLQILVPCIPGWKTEPKDTIELAKLAALTGIYPVVEYINGQLGEVMKRPAQPPRVEDYLKPQGRFKHLFKDQRGKEQIAYIQHLADENAKKYNL
ncbi:MAG: Pyruvate ferredoxin oxidoreductase, beta subunit [Parcubacteria group bacterium GW2011_GWC2_42_12]|uniref:Pyruvate ferredoxin oxidoreductase n=2 Tax=Candidatus Falkowiibacteriota TaxID=1752728 RepID=A0A1F5S7A1_9BACT|nr:MAG: Pyruvate ferredoxin oxidoreductase, beta subunit [Candidatus Falkowbacteria bacterium GW2011_GWA2_41_14]KKS35318.1 MAG: Pyruvate ferredoxin oxidoreductase, beta subunit [Parcubacteria group bacterium GW2011_GWC2_42_12]OGF22432.1 MAG: pyruvate ferredoxin oxidoreductase [Candidatus Falkowbacteria bacterium RIFCSPHIGHO2_02_FULL_42_9]